MRSNLVTTIVATSLGFLLVQGAGASTLVPCSLALLNQACHGDALTRARAVSLWTAAGSIGLALGPVLGGVPVTAFGRRSIFLVNLPIGAAGIWLARRFVDEAPTYAGGTDVVGQLLATTRLFCLTGAVIEAGVHGCSSPTARAGVMLAAIAGGGFMRGIHLATVPRSRAGVASGVLNAVRQAGGAIGVALFGALMGRDGRGIDEAFQAGALMLIAAAAVAACFIGATRAAMIACAAPNATDRG